MKTQSKIETLRQTNPEIAISIHWEPDYDFVWDGEGEDPALVYMTAHNVEVRASRIVAGELQTGKAFLGGCYSADAGKDDPEISGYLDQLTDEAVADLG